MKYEKANVEVIDFGKTVSFMTYSGGPAGKAAAEAAALTDPAVTSEINNDNWYASVDSSSYDPSTGIWTVVVDVYNKGGHKKVTVTVYE